MTQQRKLVLSHHSFAFRVFVLVGCAAAAAIFDKLKAFIVFDVTEESPNYSPTITFLFQTLLSSEQTKQPADGVDVVS